MAFRWLLTVNIIAMVALTVAFLLGIKIRLLMGKGRDTKPIKILLIVIGMNGMLGLQFLIGGYLKYLGLFVDYIRLSDVTIMIVGIALSILLYRLYSDYNKLIKRNEPSA